MLYVLIIVFSLSLYLGALLLPRVVELSHELHLYDFPDSRKVHKLPIPRLGGVVFLPVVTIVIAITIVVLIRIDFHFDTLWNGSAVSHFLAYMGGAMMLYAIGLYDDIHGVGYKVKFLVQIASASLLCVSGLWISNMYYIFFINELPYWVGMPVTILFVVYVTNAVNLIDGIDGLASGLSAIALLVIAVLDIMAGDGAWAMMAVAYLGVLISFFYYNVYGTSHKTFMGDAGSLTLGFTLSFLILHFWQINPVWNHNFHNVGIVAASTLVIPTFDVVRVMMSRIRDGRNPFLPDKNHIHHKLLRSGLNAKMSMVTLLLMAVGIVAINYVMASFVSQTLMIIVDMILFCVVHLILNVFIAKKEKNGIVWNKVF